MVVIVIARFQEKLEWIKTAPYNKFNLIIYNKGNNDDFTKTDKILEIINLPNIGSESLRLNLDSREPGKKAVISGLYFL